MSNKSITKNYIYNLIYQVLILIVPFITTPYISRVLGVENIGIYSYTISISAYFILFGSLGIALYGQREIAYRQNSKCEYSISFYEIVIFRIITMSISAIIFYFAFALNNEYSIYYRILMLELIGNCVDISWFFQGLEEFKKTTTRNLVVKIISVLLIFILVKSQNDLIMYYIIYVASLLFGNISLWFYLPKYIEKVSLKDINILKHLRPTISLFIPQIAIQIYTILDKTMIGNIIADKSEVGYYEQSQKIIKILLSIEGSLGIVMLPRVANSFAKNDKEQIEKYLKKAFSMAYLLAFPMIFGIIVISDEFVPIFFGPGYEKVSVIIKMLSPIILFIGVSGTIGHQYLLPTKKQKQYTGSVVCGAIINLTINGLLIRRLYSMGAVIGTVAAEFSVALIQMIMIRKEFKNLNIVKLSFKYLTSGVVMFVVCYILDSFIHNALLSIIIRVIVGIIIYFAMLLILKDEFCKEIIEKMFKKFKFNVAK